MIRAVLADLAVMLADGAERHEERLEPLPANRPAQQSRDAEVAASEGVGWWQGRYAACERLYDEAMFKRRRPRDDHGPATAPGRSFEDQRTIENVESRALVVHKLARGWQNPFVPSRFGWNAIRIHIDDVFDGNPAFQHGGESEAFRLPMEYMAHAGYAIRYMEFLQSMAAPDADLRAAWQASVERDEVMIDPLIDWAEGWSSELDFPSIRVADAVTWTTFDEALHSYVNERYLTDPVEVRCSGVFRLGYAVRAAEYAVGMLGSAKAAPLDELDFQGQALLARGELLLRDAAENDLR